MGERFGRNAERFARNDWNGERNAERFARNDWNAEQFARNDSNGERNAERFARNDFSGVVVRFRVCIYREIDTGWYVIKFFILHGI